MIFNYSSNVSAENLIEILSNIRLLMRISPPQIKYSILDEEKNLIQQTLFVNSIKKEFKIELIHKQLSPNSFISEIISGPIKGTKSVITISQKNDKTEISVNVDLKLNFKYKLFKSILLKKLDSVNSTIFNRLENLGILLSNKKNPIVFENNYDTLVLSKPNKMYFDGWWLGDIYSSFIDDAYQHINFEDKIVVDIGGTIGDSAIGFITKGAKKIISLEPFPINYDYGKSNILKNNMLNQIEFLNAGCGPNSSKITIDSTFSGVSNQMTSSEHGIEIDQYSLSDLIEKFSISNCILKMDCEGCEYDVLLNTPDSILKKFSQIFIEYHSGSDILEEKLKHLDFKIFNSEIKKDKGYLSAKK